MQLQVQKVKMGRQKIDIKYLEKKNIRMQTFRKRVDGVFKKAIELHVLCGATVELAVVFQEGRKNYSYSSKPGAQNNLPPGVSITKVVSSNTRRAGSSARSKNNNAVPARMEQSSCGHCPTAQAVAAGHSGGGEAFRYASPCDSSSGVTTIDNAGKSFQEHQLPLHDEGLADLMTNMEFICNQESMSGVAPTDYEHCEQLDMMLNKELHHHANEQSFVGAGDLHGGMYYDEKFNVDVGDCRAEQLMQTYTHHDHRDENQEQMQQSYHHRRHQDENVQLYHDLEENFITNFIQCGQIYRH